LPPRPEAGASRDPAPAGQPGVDRAGREVWRAPGDVVIRERPPQLLGQPAATYSGPGAPGDEGAEAEPQGALGALGSHAARVRRPMPSVEDFPVVGQREYWAKAGNPDRGQPEVEPRKGGFFRRLTGGGRDKASEARQSGDRASDEPLDLPVFFRRGQGP
jgi:cell division protein FtsZ